MAFRPTPARGRVCLEGDQIILDTRETLGSLARVIPPLDPMLAKLPIAHVSQAELNDYGPSSRELSTPMIGGRPPLGGHGVNIAEAPVILIKGSPGEWTLRFRRWHGFLEILSTDGASGPRKSVLSQKQDQWITGALLRLAADYDQQAEEVEKRVRRSAGTPGRLDARGRRASR